MREDLKNWHVGIQLCLEPILKFHGNQGVYSVPVQWLGDIQILNRYSESFAKAMHKTLGDHVGRLMDGSNSGKLLNNIRMPIFVIAGYLCILCVVYIPGAAE